MVPDLGSGIASALFFRLNIGMGGTNDFTEVCPRIPSCAGCQQPLSGAIMSAGMWGRTVVGYVVVKNGGWFGCCRGILPRKRFSKNDSGPANRKNGGWICGMERGCV